MPPTARHMPQRVALVLCIRKLAETADAIQEADDEVGPDEVAERVGDRDGDASFGVSKVLRTTIDNREIMGGSRVT